MLQDVDSVVIEQLVDRPSWPELGETTEELDMYRFWLRVLQDKMLTAHGGPVFLPPPAWVSILLRTYTHTWDDAHIEKRE